MEWNLNPGGNNLELEPDDDLDDFTTPMITQTQQKNPKFMCVSERYGGEMEEVLILVDSYKHLFVLFV